MRKLLVGLIFAAILTFPTVSIAQTNVFSASPQIGITITGTKSTETNSSLPSQGLVAWYPFYGSTQDVSGNGNNAVNYGAALTTDRFLNTNSAYLFNGAAYMAMPDVFSDTVSGFTFSVWITRSVKDSNNHIILYKGTKKGEAALNISNGQVGFGVNLFVPGTSFSTQNWYSTNITDTLRTNVYYHLVGRYTKGQKVELFINGSLASFVVVPTLNLLADPNGVISAIGAHGHPSIRPTTYWNGIIDDIRIYSRTLSDAEIALLYQEPNNTSPSAPQNLIAVAGNAQVALKWSKNTEADFLKYLIYMGLDSTNLSLKDSTSASVTDTTRIIARLTIGTTYYFRVSALDFARMESPKSFAASGLTIAVPPQNLAATVGNTQVTLKWCKSTDANILKYRIYMGTDSTNLSLKDSTSASITDTTKIITGLTNGIIYYFSVSTLNTVRGESPKSFAVSGNPSAVPPQNLVATVGNAQVILKWNKSTDVNFLKYLIYMGTDSTNLSLKDSTSASSMDTTKIIIGLTNGANYYFRVSILYTVRVESPKSFAVSGIPNAVPPQNLTITAGNGQVALKWSKCTDANILKYLLYLGTDSTNLSLKDSTSASITDTIKVITGLTNATKYYFRVSTLNTVRGESPKSFSVFVTPSASIGLPIPLGLGALYSFNGNAQDISGNGNDGTNFGATPTVDRFQNANSAYLFNGAAYIAIPDVFSSTISAFTFSVWINRSVKDNNNHVILYKGTKNGEAAISITSGQLGFGVNLYVPGTSPSTQNWYSANITDTLRTNVYYHLVGRYTKGQKVELYINGTLVSSVVAANLNLVADPNGVISSIGAHGHPTIRTTTYWNGIIDDIRIYSRALSDAEIAVLTQENGWNIAPLAPQNLATSVGNGQVTLKWSKNMEADFLKYRIYMGTDSLNLLLKDSTSAFITDTSKVITGLTNGIKYYFRVSALDSARLESPKSFAVSGIPNAIVIKMDTAYVSTTGANITVFLTVQNFANIGSITLKIGYSNTTLTYVGLDTPPTGTLDNTTQGNILIGWQNILLLSKNNGDRLLGLKFTYNGGLGIGVVSSLSFVVSSCEITDALGASLSVSYIDGGVKFITGVKLSGIVQYYGANKTPISNAVVTLTPISGVGRSKVSGADGTYSFDSLNTGQYTLTVSKTGTWGGVTGGDALLVARHAAGLSLLTDTPLLAADANASGSITGGDALLILRRAVGLDQTFAAGDWVFSPQTATVSGTNVTANISGLAMGDVNASYVPSSGTVFAKSNGFISLNPDGIKNVAPVGTFEIPIHGTSDMSLGAVSLRINFPSEIVDFKGATSQLPGFVCYADERSITIGWIDLSGKTPFQFILNEPLVSLKFSPKVNSSTVAIAIDSWSELADAQGGLIPNAKLTAPTVEISDHPTTFALGQNYPNPFNPSTIIAYELPKDMKVSIKVFNALGQQVMTLVDGLQTAGHHEVTCEIKIFPSGIYFYQMTAESFSQTKKMIVMK